MKRNSPEFQNIKIPVEASIATRYLEADYSRIEERLLAHYAAENEHTLNQIIQHQTRKK